MASKSEQGFGARLQRAKEMSTRITSYPNFNPPKDEDQADVFQELVNQIENANTQAISAYEYYTMAVDQRQGVFTLNANSLKMVLVDVRAAVIAQYGKSSKELEIVAGILRKLRGTKLLKAPKQLETDTQLTSSSTSQRSFGSMILFFKSLVINLEQFDNFNPSNPNLSILGLNNLLNDLNEKSLLVTNTELPLKMAQKTRTELYADLDQRRTRIINYVSSFYGRGSVEFTAIKKL